MMTKAMNKRSGATMIVSVLLGGAMLAGVSAGMSGCAQAESRNWAQTSPLIEPRVQAESDFHLGAHSDVALEEDENALP